MVRSNYFGIVAELAGPTWQAEETDLSDEHDDLEIGRISGFVEVPDSLVYSVLLSANADVVVNFGKVGETENPTVVSRSMSRKSVV